MIKNKIEILFCLVHVIEIDDIRVNCIVQSTLPVQIEKVIMFTDMYYLSKRLNVRVLILFICLSLSIFLFQWQLKICILCGFIGHLHWNCHQRGCFRCGCPGHMTRDCTEPSFSKWHPCFRCGMQGHNKKVMVFVCKC